MSMTLTIHKVNTIVYDRRRMDDGGEVIHMHFVTPEGIVEVDAFAPGAGTIELREVVATGEVWRPAGVEATRVRRALAQVSPCD